MRTAPSEGVPGGQPQIDPLTVQHTTREVPIRVDPSVPD